MKNFYLIDYFWYEDSDEKKQRYGTVKYHPKPSDKSIEKIRIEARKEAARLEGVPVSQIVLLPDDKENISW